MSYRDFQIREKFDQIVEDAEKHGRHIGKIGDMYTGYLLLEGDFSLLELRAIVAAWEEVFPDRETVSRNRT